jgi:high-affinity iron transporter
LHFVGEAGLRRKSCTAAGLHFVGEAGSREKGSTAGGLASTGRATGAPAGRRGVRKRARAAAENATRAGVAPRSDSGLAWANSRNYFGLWGKRHVLATFVIGLREGLEAALIVGIIATFLRQRGRPDLIGRVWVGVSVAVVLCLAAAIGLQILNADLPGKQQEALEVIIGVVAVGMVSYMLVWMQRHARGFKGTLERATADALATGSAWALVGMAFAAVMREGLETAVFLVATFQASDNALLASIGAVLGILAAAGLGFALYKGSVKINLAHFFSATSIVLILVAAGLVMSSLHAAHSAGWVGVGQQPVADLTWLVQPGSVQAALLTGMLGLRAQPTQIEVIGWLLYVIGAAAFILWPRHAATPVRTSTRRPELTRV